MQILQGHKEVDIDTGKQIHKVDTEETDTHTHAPNVAARACVGATEHDEQHVSEGGLDVVVDKPVRRRRTPRSAGGSAATQMRFPDSLVHEAVEPDDLWAAKEWLARVFGWEWVASDTLMQWRRWCKPFVKEGGRDMFSRFVSTKETHAWVDEDGKDWRELVGKPWFARQWSAFVNAEKGRRVGPTMSRHTSSRDAGRITDAPAEGGESGCALCGRPVRGTHRDDCPVLEKGYGPEVEPDHRNGMWCVQHGIRRRKYGAS